ncbi:MAG: primosomal replication protein N [Azoarcus sp.]|nr:primosomal replication protein N [Azoarcus sp.]
MSTEAANELRLAARIVEISALRRTPAGIPVLSCILAHESRQIEAGIAREVKLELPAMAIGELAQTLAAVSPGTDVSVTGFMAAKSARSRMPVLHLNAIEFTEGI